MPFQKYWFNFSSSYTGGGLKRLRAYVQWFDQQGGALFFIHPQCRALIEEFPCNHYEIITQSYWQRLLNDGWYLQTMQKRYGKPLFYYAYGIPIYHPVAEKNWFHLSNVLPLCRQHWPRSWKDMMRHQILRQRIRYYVKYADILSAESEFSLALLQQHTGQQGVVSVNGTELHRFLDNTYGYDPVAVVVGTMRYKALDQSVAVFDYLYEQDNALELMIFGDPQSIPHHLRSHPRLHLPGVVPQTAVMQQLNRAAFYISTTTIENSYNAAAEGVYLAQSSYISDIPPHRDLLSGAGYSIVQLSSVINPLLYVTNDQLTSTVLKTWDQVIVNMLDTAGLMLPSQQRALV